MPIPNDILMTAKDLVRLPDSNQTYDEMFDRLYARALDEVVRSTDWLAVREDLDTVSGQRVYQCSAQLSRLLAVLHAGIHLPKVVANTMDRLRETWQAGAEAEAPGTPEVWWVNQIPESFTPESFVVHPPPAAGGTDALTTFQIARPENDDPVTLWLRPWLVYKIVAQFLGGSHPQRDMVGAGYFENLASVWMQIYKGRMPAS